MNGIHHEKTEQWIALLNDDDEVVVRHCRQILHGMVPQIEERFSFGIPFYHYFGMFCYINKVNDGIMLGFCRGKDLLLSYPQLTMQGRKMVAGITLSKPGDFMKFQVRELIAGAAIWQREAAMLGRKFANRKQ